MAGRRTLILADLHLTRHTPPAVATDLVAFVAAHPGERLIFAGDLFDLSAESPRVPRERGVAAGLERFPAVRAALATHVDRGGELWLVSGNHDAEVGAASGEAGASDLAAALGVGATATPRLKTTPWFLRDGGLHVEHGHLYDPDNAPAHPLAASARSLGVHFVEQFIAPTGAFAYLNANDGTPLRLFLSSFAWYGRRAPYVIYRFFRTAFSALATSGPFFADERRRATDAATRVDAFARGQGVSVDVANGALAARARPTLDSMARTFARLYLDRVAATVGVGAGAAALAFGRPREGALAVGLGGALLAASWALGHDRYAGNVTERLARGAADVVSRTSARLVVFGHTHREALGESYANTGSFAFPRGAPGRPLLEIEGPPAAPRAVRRHFRAAQPTLGA